MVIRKMSSAKLPLSGGVAAIATAVKQKMIPIRALIAFRLSIEKIETPCKVWTLAREQARPFVDWDAKRLGGGSGFEAADLEAKNRCIISLLSKSLKPGERDRQSAVKIDQREEIRSIRDERVGGSFAARFAPITASCGPF
jgi:hypothetical protein